MLTHQQIPSLSFVLAFGTVMSEAERSGRRFAEPNDMLHHAAELAAVEVRRRWLRRLWLTHWRSASTRSRTA